VLDSAKFLALERSAVVRGLVASSRPQDVVAKSPTRTHGRIAEGASAKIVRAAYTPPQLARISSSSARSGSGPGRADRLHLRRGHRHLSAVERHHLHENCGEVWSMSCSGMPTTMHRAGRASTLSTERSDT